MTVVLVVSVQPEPQESTCDSWSSRKVRDDISRIICPAAGRSDLMSFTFVAEERPVPDIVKVVDVVASTAVGLMEVNVGICDTTVSPVSW